MNDQFRARAKCCCGATIDAVADGVGRLPEVMRDLMLGYGVHVKCSDQHASVAGETGHPLLTVTVDEYDAD